MSLRIPRVFVLPALVSLALSASTVGTRVHWQDAGYFLAGVRELGVLYQPGFVLYQVLCAGWVRLLGFVDFILAVHLFSAVCAALAAGLIGLAARDFLRSRSPFFGIDPDRDGPFAEAAAIGAGILVASGYTFWAAAILAKCYSFYYAMLAALLWRLIRAAETGRPRDFTIVAVLIGLSWAAHPAATLAGAGLIGFVAAHARTVGAAGLAGRVLLAAAVAMAPSLALLPVFAGNETMTSVGNPTTFVDVLRYLRGSSFVTGQAFGSGPERWGNTALYFFQEYLVLGVAGAAVGLWRVRTNRRTLLFILLWSGVYTAVATLVSMGQSDHYLVGAWIPLALPLALALAALGRGAGRIAVSAVVVLALATSIGVNYPLLNQRGYDLAEMYGRIHLEPAARHERAIVVLTRDDAIPVCVALQSVRGFHRHVAVVAGVALEERQSGLPSWYDRRLRKHFPWIRPGDYEDLRRVFGPAPGVGPSIAAFANANAGVPIYFDQPPPREMLRQDFDVVPAGVLWKLVPSTDLRIDRRDWDFPTTPEALVAQQRRARGFYMVGQPGGGFRLTAQAYEQTFFRELVQARAALGLWEASEGRSREAAALLRSVVSLDPRTYSTPVHLLALGKALIDLGSHAEAEPVLKGALRPEAPPGLRARVHLALARAAAGRGDAPGARVELERALSAAPELADQIRSEARAAGLLPD